MVKIKDRRFYLNLVLLWRSPFHGRSDQYNVPSPWRTSFHVSLMGGLLKIYSLSFCQKKFLFLLHFQIDTFSGCGILGWWRFSLSTQNLRGYICIYIYRRRRWHPTPVLLPGKSHGRRSLVGCGPWGCKESDTTEWLHFTSLHFIYKIDN